MMINIKLHRLIGSEIVEREFDGKLVQGLWFPLEFNGVEVYKNKYYNMSFYVSPSRMNEKNRTGYLTLRFPPNMKDEYNKVVQSGLWEKNLKYIGNMYGEFDKDFQWTEGKKHRDVNLEDAFNKE